jgi:hypothetical protein
MASELCQNSEAITVHSTFKIKPSAKYTLCDGVVTILSLLLYVADIVTGRETFAFSVTLDTLLDHVSFF